ncbi:Rod binding domain-containing protein [Methylopila capsulata]|uniref:Rod binding domain-containing protein n=1 Tax=Methylopila capsulata TaxID=61654 RepID=A0A9W6IQ50_9HYPH|nr:rod-binding protein [Methylopila capsulata]MBM7851396.1 Rod binding domain-containing protein [Methylopila capsulata]GLK54453.1 hypothetical protein GCM10008170_04720 [Methylopila capsulata]
MAAAASAAGASTSAAQTVYAAHPQAKAASKLDAAAQDFEAVFLTQMMQSMFTDVGEDGPLGGGAGTDAYRSMLADQYGRNIAASGGVGIAAQVRSELLALQQGT